MDFDQWKQTFKDSAALTLLAFVVFVFIALPVFGFLFVFLPLIVMIAMGAAALWVVLWVIGIIVGSDN